MPGYLLDTNIISELRRKQRADAGVLEWFKSEPDADLYLSVMTLGEIRKGIEQLRRRDAAQAQNLALWVTRVEQQYSDKILPVTLSIADRWGRLLAVRPLPQVDALIAATAHEHDLTVVTRNASDFDGLGIRVLNPFQSL